MMNRLWFLLVFPKNHRWKVSFSNK